MLRVQGEPEIKVALNSHFYHWHPLLNLIIPQNNNIISTSILVSFHISIYIVIYWTLILHKMMLMHIGCYRVCFWGQHLYRCEGRRIEQRKQLGCSEIPADRILENTHARGYRSGKCLDTLLCEVRGRKSQGKV